MAWFSRGTSRRSDIDDEIAAHLAMAVRDRVETGDDPEAARLSALREFGNVTLTREAAQSVWRRWWIAIASDLWQDVRYAVRLLARSPAFAAIVVLVLGLGIGANALVFTVFRAIFLRPLPGVAAPTGLGVIVSKSSGGRTFGMSYPDYEYLRDHDRSFNGVAAAAMAPFSLGRGNRGERVWGEMVSGNYFQVLGVGAVVGRTLLPSDDVAPGKHPVVVISEGLWRRAFGADPDVVGRVIHINAIPLTVVGVAAGGFRGSVVSLVMDVFIPIMEEPVLETPGAAPVSGGMLRQRNVHWLMVLGRPKPGVTLAGAAAETRTLAAQLAADNPLAEFSQRAAVLPLWRSPYGAQTYLLPVIVMLGIMAGLILLIVCANVASLVLARGLTRRGELAVRVALGAGRIRILRLLLIENLALAVPGALAGVILIRALVPMASLGPAPVAPMPIALDLRTDTLVAVFALALSCASALVFGFVPAFNSSRVDLASVMKDELSPRGSGSGARTRLRSALVVTQLAVSLLLLVSAGLVVRSLSASRTADAGFDPHHVVSLSFDLQPNGYDEARGRVFFQQALDAARSVPGVESATLAATLPLSLVDRSSRAVEIENYQRRKDEDLTFLYNVIAPDYFETLRIGVIAGRGFEPRDDADAPPAVIVNETMARRFWKTPQAAIGQRIRSPQWRTIVGVVKDVKYARLTEDPRPHLYLPLFQRYQSDMTLQVRGAGPSKELIARVRAAVERLDPNLPILEARPFDEQVRVALVGFEMAAGTLTVFGAIAGLLAAIGLYGLIAYTVEQSRHEVGICMALGASRGDVLKRFLGRGLRLGVVGTTVGLGIAAATARLMTVVLYGVSAMDPGTFAAAAAAVLTIAITASFLPAWRASRTDPIAALRRH
jgi:putative ABC transport system permease protein